MKWNRETIGDISLNNKLCENCGKEIMLVFEADTEFYGHETWKYMDGSIYCEPPKTAYPKRVIK